MRDFCDALSAELHKVHDFMRHQQETLQDQLPGMLLEETSQPSRGRSRASSETGEVEKCAVMVRKIESFRHYSDLTFEAMRKIIKKFDKRFHCRFQETIGMPATAQQLVTAEDISLRVLQPAHECLRQMRVYTSNGSTSNMHSISGIERPLLKLRQITFWLQEVENGVQLLGLHISGAGEDWNTCVKKTFIEVSELRESPLRRRRANSWCTQIALPMDNASQRQSDQEESFDDAKDAEESCSSTHGSQGSRGAFERPSTPRGKAKGPSVSSRGQQRWWMELSDLCPLSGFPIAHLPYPPFKLQLGRGQGHQFFDGQFLLLHLLSSFNFEVRGKPLNEQEIQALDQHVKKCKLSPLRLSRALELLCLVSQGSAGAKQEMQELRSRATKKLGTLKHIQRARLQRGDCATPAAVGPVSRPRRAERG